MEKGKQKTKETKARGITLIALVITIIVLLILAGVTIAALSGPNGILENAKKAKQETQESQEKELDSLETAESMIEEYTNPELKTMKLRVNSGETGEVKLPIPSNEENNYTIDWGDGTVAEVKNETKVELGKVATTEPVKIAATDEKAKHTYASPNQEYVVSITGTVKEIDTGYVSDYSILEVEQWGELGIEYISLNFCHNLTEIASPTKNSFMNLKNIYFFNSGLEEIPEDLFSNCVNITSFDGAFEQTNITEIPEDLFKNCENVTSFDDTFAYTQITKIPEDLFKNCKNVTSFDGTFAYTQITEIPEDLFSNCINVTNFNDTFAYTQITEIQEDLFSNCVNVTDFDGTFAGTNITEIPENLFKNCDNATFKQTFYGCENLQNYLKLWEQDYYESGSNENVSEDMGGEGCYANCTQLLAKEGSKNIPDYWKEALPS